jgi:hypothetical protein
VAQRQAAETELKEKEKKKEEKCGCTQLYVTGEKWVILDYFLRSEEKRSEGF